MNEAELLKNHRFSRGLSEAQVSELVSCARAVHFAEGAIVFREGGEANAIYLLLNGHVVLEQHVPGKGEVELESLIGGDILGLSWLSPGGKWQLDARAVEPTQALLLDAKCVQGHMHRDASLGLAIAKQIIEELCQRLERVRMQRLDVYRGGR